MFVGPDGRRAADPFSDDLRTLRLVTSNGQVFTPLPGARERFEAIWHAVIWDPEIPRYVYDEAASVLAEWLYDYGFRTRREDAPFWRGSAKEAARYVAHIGKVRADQRSAEREREDRERPLREAASRAWQKNYRRARVRAYLVAIAQVIVVVGLWSGLLSFLALWLNIDEEGPFFERLMDIYMLVTVLVVCLVARKK